MKVLSLYFSFTENLSKSDALLLVSKMNVEFDGQIGQKGIEKNSNPSLLFDEV